MRRLFRNHAVRATALLVVVTTSYMLLVSRADWLGLFPSRSSPSFTPSAQPSLPAPARYRPPHEVELTLEALRKSFVAEYARHSPSPPPEPVYAAPWLSSEQAYRYAAIANPPNGAIVPRIMITTITREITSQLPDLLNTIAVLVHFLGPDRLTFSILEGPSDDATPYILNRVLRPLLRDLRVPTKAVQIQTNAPKIKWDEVNRIEALAELRNKALKPMLDRWSGDVGPIVFLNDVFLHASDILELLYQHSLSKASITTAWDWMQRDPAYFYDVWVARTIDTGDLFYPIPGNEWYPSDDILSTSPASKEAFHAFRPFQAYSSWNALAVLDSAPFFLPHKVRFRRGGMGECAASECLLICSDFWKAGHGRIQVVPSVQLAYERDVALQTAKRLRQDTMRLGWKGGVPLTDTPIQWEEETVLNLKPSKQHKLAKMALLTQEVIISLQEVSAAMTRCAAAIDSTLRNPAAAAFALQHPATLSTLESGAIIAQGLAAAVAASSEGATKKRSRKEKKPKDPKAPKRPPSAYLLYQNNVREGIRTANPNMPYKDVLGVIAEQWKALSPEERKVYEHAYSLATEDFRKRDLAYKHDGTILPPAIGISNYSGHKDESDSSDDSSSEDEPPAPVLPIPSKKEKKRKSDIEVKPKKGKKNKKD
ncbi:hypothetical protein CspHIS471_0602120 [Cutaneotrichosporon sp. HIS471]|nr:hypothetical protein CspHIS471_0602120 [Cutaneotrichosporon sp. HIS471]